MTREEAVAYVKARIDAACALRASESPLRECVECGELTLNRRCKWCQVAKDFGG
jgi:recombinational DNA repair protein RecR